MKNFVRSLLILMFMTSSIGLSSVLPEGSHRPDIFDEYDQHMEKSGDAFQLMDSHLNNQQCAKPGFRVWGKYDQSFSRVSDAQAWCADRMFDFSLAIEFVFEHCGWQQGGSWGNYQYQTRFLHYVQFPGSPQFSFQRYTCNGDGSYNGGGGY